MCGRFPWGKQRESRPTVIRINDQNREKPHVGSVKGSGNTILQDGVWNPSNVLDQLDDCRGGIKKDDQQTSKSDITQRQLL